MGMRICIQDRCMSCEGVLIIDRLESNPQSPATSKGHFVFGYIALLTRLGIMGLLKGESNKRESPICLNFGFDH